MIERISIAAIAILLFTLFAGFAGTEQWAITTFQIGTFVLGGVWTVMSLIRGGKATANFTMGCLLVAPLIGCAQLLAGISVFPFATLKQILIWTSYLVIASVAAQCCRERRYRILLGEMLYRGGLGVVVFGLLHYYSAGSTLYWNWASDHGPVFAPFINRDHFAAFAELLLPFAVFRSIEMQDSRAAQLVAVALLYAGIIASGSRAGAAIGLVEITVVWVLSGRRQEFRLKRRLAAGLVVLMLLLAAAAGPELLLKKIRMGDEGNTRLQMTRSAIAMFLERPIAGHGLGTFEAAYPRFATFDGGVRVDHAHNDWAEWMAEGGMATLLVMLFFFAYALRAAWREPWAMGVPALLVHGLVDFPMQMPALAATVFLIAQLTRPFTASSKTLVKNSREVGEHPI